MTSRILLVSSLLIASSLLACDCGCDDAPIAATSTEAGSDVQAVTLTWEVQGMHCGGCANALKGKIVALSGVSSCDVSFDDSKAVVVADPAQTDAIEGAITGLGYTATAQQ